MSTRREALEQGSLAARFDLEQDPTLRGARLSVRKEAAEHVWVTTREMLGLGRKSEAAFVAAYLEESK
jgi:hypothetical protein